MWGHKGKGQTFRGSRGHRSYTKTKNKEQKCWYVRTGVVEWGRGAAGGMCCCSLGQVVHSADVVIMALNLRSGVFGPQVSL